MRKIVTTALAFALVATLLALPALAKTYSFELGREARLNGATLEPGKYKLELNGENEAVIYNSHNNEAVTTAAVKVKQRKNGSTRASVLIDRDGNIAEVRFQKQVVVFVR